MLFLNSDRDDLPENLGTTTAHERQKVHFRLMSVAEKRLYLSSLSCFKGVVSYTQATVPQLHHLVCRFFCLYCASSVLFLPLRYFYPLVTIMCNSFCYMSQTRRGNLVLKLSNICYKGHYCIMDPWSFTAAAPKIWNVLSDYIKKWKNFDKFFFTLASEYLQCS